MISTWIYPTTLLEIKPSHYILLTDIFFVCLTDIKSTEYNMQSIKSLETKDSYKLHNRSNTANRDFAKRAKVILDMEAAREYLNCAFSYALKSKQWFTSKDYPNPAATAFEEIKRFHCSNMYGVDVELKESWGFEYVFYNQDAFHRYFAEYSTDCNMFIPSELFNHGDNPWTSVENKLRYISVLWQSP